jgi:hypothetical protein
MHNSNPELPLQRPLHYSHPYIYLGRLVNRTQGGDSLLPDFIFSFLQLGTKSAI